MIPLRERLMSETKKFLKTWRGFAGGVGLLFLAALALAGCAGPMVISAVEPTATVYPVPPTDIPAPPPGPTPVPLDFPLAAATHVEAAPVTDQTCVDCHTSEQVLKSMAKEEEGGETLSEGEG